MGTKSPSEYDYPPPDLTSRMVNVQQHDERNPLWEGPWGEGDNGGITQSMISRFLSCRDRFRLRYVLGLEPHDKWNHRLGYGNMWHVCEEAFASAPGDSHPKEPHESYMWESELYKHTQGALAKYPFQRDEIVKWYNVCLVQFPEYVKYWSTHPDVLNRKPLLQEEVFRVPYQLPSGRVVYLRGKWDSVDLIEEETEGKLGRHQQSYSGIYLQENKTKSDIDKLQVERQVKYDLQTNLYLIALHGHREVGKPGTLKVCMPGTHKDHILNIPIKGVRYNVVRRPLSGGKGNISPHKAKFTKSKTTPAETEEHFYQRLRDDYFVKEPDYWFFRVRSEITQDDLNEFRRETLDPILEQMCAWYEQVTGKYQNFKRVDGRVSTPLNYRTPFGVFSSLEENGATEYDAYFATGSEVGLRRVTELFMELK